MTIAIVPFDNDRHREAVIRLWMQVFGYDTPRKAPDLVIDKKRSVDDGLFFVAEKRGAVAGTVMAGYDGHRGWIYSLAVHLDHRRQGIGSRLLAHAERTLTDRGCVKVNLQILADNAGVQAFYETHGYTEEPRISMGKRIPGNIPIQDPSGPKKT
jgi:ribosomal protein S18 acetylase RimI-like enzyme